MELFYIIGSSDRWRTLRGRRSASARNKQSYQGPCRAPSQRELRTRAPGSWHGARCHGLSIRVVKCDTQPFVFCVCVRVWVSRMPGSATRCPSGMETLTPHPTLQGWLLAAFLPGD